MTTLNATAYTKLIATYANAADVGSLSISANDDHSMTFTDGTGAGAAQKYWESLRTLAASATENIDLSGGITDVFGNVLTLTAVKILRIRASSANTNDVVIGGAASNAFPLFGGTTPTLAIKPGGEVLIVAPDANGYTVTAATGDILKVLNGGAGTSVSYTIEIVGK